MRLIQFKFLREGRRVFVIQSIPHRPNEGFIVLGEYPDYQSAYAAILTLCKVKDGGYCRIGTRFIEMEE